LYDVAGSVNAPDYALADFDRATWLIAGLVDKVGTKEPRPVLVFDLATFAMLRELCRATDPNLTGGDSFIHNGCVIQRGGRPR
jgi:hypothetical protein